MEMLDGEEPRSVRSSTPRLLGDQSTDEQTAPPWQDSVASCRPAHVASYGLLAKYLASVSFVVSATARSASTWERCPESNQAATHGLPLLVCRMHR